MGNRLPNIGIATVPQHNVSLTLSSILPNISQSLDGTGFIFGAGASFEAGYPLMTKLTKEVISALSGSERSTLSEVLNVVGMTYDESAGIPNIEILADVVMSHYVTVRDDRFRLLEEKFRELILDNILSVESPNLSNHVTFFQQLKNRSFGQPCTVWIFTTNYDTLFETAAAIAGVHLENGFVGATERYYAPEVFHRVYGSIKGDRFTPDAQLTVRLIKLHGSISWFKDGDRIYERHPSALGAKNQRVMIMPRRQKVMDTLVYPYDSLFSVSTRVLGTQCRYLASCGFSFSDNHINKNILDSVLKNKRCQLSILSQSEPTDIPEFIGLPNFNGGYSSHLNLKGQRVEGTTDLWKFSKFIALF